MSSKRIRQIVLIALLLAALAFAGGLFLNWQASRNFGIDIGGLTGASANGLAAPTFMYAFAGPPTAPLQQPTGVLVDGDKVIVTDAARGALYQFKIDGTFVKMFGVGNVQVPLYLAKNPLTGDYWVTDRGTRSIHIFTSDGVYRGEFDPKLPKSQWPKIKSDFKSPYHWAPIAMAFAPDGTMYVVEILNGHRLVIFDPTGKFKRSVGTVGLVNTLTSGPGIFQFPNSVKVIGNEVWVADSNNRRIQVFNLKGDFIEFVPTQGLPRGIAAFDVSQPASGSAETTPSGHVAVVDTLAQDVTIWGTDAKQLVSFGEPGVLDGQFAYPGDVSVDGKDRIFITDTSNSRVQVWGWPSKTNPMPLPNTPWQALLLLLLLLLPLLLLLLRRKKFYATPDFVHAMIAADLVHLMPAKRRKWIVTQETHDMFAAVEQGDVKLGELLEVEPYSDSEARALEERLEIGRPEAIDLAEAKTAKVFCTENVELRRLARTLELDVVDREAFIERFGEKSAHAGGGSPDDPQPPVPGDTE